LAAVAKDMAASVSFAPSVAVSASFELASPGPAPSAPSSSSSASSEGKVGLTTPATVATNVGGKADKVSATPPSATSLGSGQSLATAASDPDTDISEIDRRILALQNYLESARTGILRESIGGSS
jgi:hypothetical protein